MPSRTPPNHASGHSPECIPLPAAPEDRARREFPLLASAAPVVGALVMWAVTQSPFALVFAFLGPVIAVASMLDDRRHGRRSAREELRRFEHEVGQAMAGIEAEHDRERRSLGLLVFDPGELLDGPSRHPEWWRSDLAEPVLVTLGRGTTASTLELAPQPSVGGTSAPNVAEAHGRLRQQASRLTDAPIVVDARDGIGVIGPQVPAEALARGILCQLLFRLSPADVVVFAGEGEPHTWLGEVPHRLLKSTEPTWVTFARTGAGDRADDVVCVTARRQAELSRRCRVIIRVGEPGATVRGPGGAEVDDLRPLFISDAQARTLARKASDAAAEEGLRHGGASGLPALLQFSALAPAVGAGLPAHFMVGNGGVLPLDLVADGPHAIIGGTTGSGKSELLVSWVLAMASASSPEVVNVLLVDFKGGSSFSSVQGLPHIVGLLTDLDHAAAARALASLRAELRYRERLLADAGARSIDELGNSTRLPRLVIAVDEFAVVVSDFPELQTLFADIAARGRSLGVHLILCTQRPAGVVRDAVLANCTLRLSLRVNNHADSVAVIGTPDAGNLPRQPFGRCYLSTAGETPIEAQVAIATVADADRVAQRWASVPHTPRRPWLDPLPPRISMDLVATVPGEPGLAFGLTDIPDEQSQPAAVYDPERDGNLIVIGGHGSGKTGLLAALRTAAQPGGPSTIVQVPGDIEGAWDVVGDAVAQLRQSATAPVLYLIDDIDALLDRLPDDHLRAFTDHLTRLLREGPTAARRVVMTAARLTSATQHLATLCDSRIVLRMPGRQEHLMAGGDADGYVPRMPAGAGSWRGHRIQVGHSAITLAAERARPLFEFSREGCAVVSATPRMVAERLRAAVAREQATAPATVVELSDRPRAAEELDITAAGVTTAWIGDATAWQSQWTLFSAARSAVPVLFIGCSVSEFRVLTGIRALPPPIGNRAGGAWLLEPDGTIIRVQLPDWLA